MSFRDRVQQRSFDPVVTHRLGLRPQDHLKRKPRHAGIFKTLHALDTELDEVTRHEVARWVGEQYAAEYGSVLLGLVAKCYLGSPYVDHRLDLFGAIVEHYAPSDPMPSPYENARMLARSGAYAFVEVHSDGSIVPVHDDGSIS
jgi:hypothetical protein